MTIGPSTLLSAGHCGPNAEVLRCINDDGETIPPGRFVYRSAASNAGTGGALSLAKLPAAADFSARALSLAPTGWGSGETGVLTIAFRGESLVFTQAWDTDLTTTLTALAAAANDGIDDKYTAASAIVVANAGGTAITVTSEVAGEFFQARLAVGGGTVAPTVSTAGTNVLAALVGVSTVDNTSNIAGTVGHDQNAPFEAACKGEVHIALDAAGVAAQTTQWYLDTSSGNEGKLTTTSDANAIWIPPAMFRAFNVPASTTVNPVGAAVYGRLDMSGAIAAGGL